MQAVIINTLAIAIASLIGLCLRRGMPKRITDAVMQALGLCTILIGIQGAAGEKHIRGKTYPDPYCFGGNRNPHRRMGRLGWSCESMG